MDDLSFLDDWISPPKPDVQLPQSLGFLKDWVDPPKPESASERTLRERMRYEDDKKESALSGPAGAIQDVSRYLLNRSVPVASGLLGRSREANAQAARGKVAEGTGSSEDYDTTFRAEERQAAEQNKSTGRAILDTAASLPAIIGEAIPAGRIAGLGLRAAGMGAGKTLLGQAARGGATMAAATPAMLSTWLENSQQRVEKNGGHWYDPENMAPAMAQAAITNAVLGQIGKFAPAVGSKVPTLIGRTAATAGTGAVLMPIEQQAADAVSSRISEELSDKFKVETRYGTIGHFLRGEKGEGWKSLAVQAVLGAGFAAFHGREAKPVEKLAETIDALGKTGLSEKGVGNAIQREISPVVEAIRQGTDPTPIIEKMPAGKPKELAKEFAKASDPFQGLTEKEIAKNAKEFGLPVDAFKAMVRKEGFKPKGEEGPVSPAAESSEPTKTPETSQGLIGRMSGETKPKGRQEHIDRTAEVFNSVPDGHYLHDPVTGATYLITTGTQKNGREYVYVEVLKKDGQWKVVGGMTKGLVKDGVWHDNKTPLIHDGVKVVDAKTAKRLAAEEGDTWTDPNQKPSGKPTVEQNAPTSPAAESKEPTAQPAGEAQIGAGAKPQEATPIPMRGPLGRPPGAKPLDMAGPGFKTAKGSDYALHPDGTTTRVKAERKDAGHEGDFGEKDQSHKTVYVDGDVVSALSSAGMHGIGKRGARLAMKDGKATLLTWNEKEQRWGAAPTGKDVAVSDTPKVGLHPLELWDRIDDVPGFEAYTKQHAGSKITEIRSDKPKSVSLGPGWVGKKRIDGTQLTRHFITGPDGKELGNVNVYQSGKTLHVDWGGVSGAGAKDKAAKGALGPKVVIETFRELAKAYPEAEFLKYTPAEGRLNAGSEKWIELEKYRRPEAKSGQGPIPEPKLPSAEQRTTPPAAEESGRPMTPEEKAKGQVGGGQENAGEAKPDPLRETALANKRVDEERVKNGLPPLMAEARKSNPEVWDRAMKMLADDPAAGTRLVDELAKKSRPVTAEENALLLHQKIGLSNEYERAIRQAADAFREKNMSLFDSLAAKSDDLLAQTDRLNKVERSTGSEAGRAFQFRKQLANEQFELTRMMIEAQIKKKAPLTPEEQLEIQKLHDRIKELETELAKIQGGEKVPGKDEKDVTIDINKEKQKYRDRIEKFVPRSFGRRTFDVAKETGNLYRAFKTAYDLSAVLRQGGINTGAMLVRQPVKVGKNLVGMVKDMLNERHYDRNQLDIRGHKDFKRAEDAGLYLSDMPELGLKGTKEETFAGKYPWLRAKLGISAAERAYNGYLNRLRFDTFNFFMDRSAKGTATGEEAKALANGINVATGRGKTPESWAGAMNGASQVLFSPRYMLSRFQLLAGQPFYSGTWRTRRILAAEMARSLTAFGVFVGLVKASNPDVEVEWNPRSSDFGKMRFGNFRLDPLAGLSQTWVFLTRMLTGETKSAGTGKIHDLRGSGRKFGEDDMLDVAARFGRNKLAPLPSIGADVGTGQTGGYNPAPTPGALLRLVRGKGTANDKAALKSEALDVIRPISFGDVYDALKDQGVPRGVALSLAAILGQGTQLYEPKAKK